MCGRNQSTHVRHHLPPLLTISGNTFGEVFFTSRKQYSRTNREYKPYRTDSRRVRHLVVGDGQTNGYQQVVKFSFALTTPRWINLCFTSTTTRKKTIGHFNWIDFSLALRRGHTFSPHSGVYCGNLSRTVRTEAVDLRCGRSKHQISKRDDWSVSFSIKCCYHRYQFCNGRLPTAKWDYWKRASDAKWEIIGMHLVFIRS